MSISSFRLKGTLGRNYKTDFNDTLRTKKALRDLDYYEEPSYGMTGYPDEALFSAIEEFQSDHGLQRDGIMKPGGPTASEMGVQLASVHRENPSDEDPAPLPGLVSDDTKIAASGARPIPFGPPLPLGPGKELGDQLRRWWDGNQWPDPANENKRTTVTDPFPLRPEPVEPPKIPNRTELVPPVLGQTDLTNPIPEKLDDGVYINKIPDEDFLHFGEIVHANENEATKQQARDLKKRTDVAHPDWTFLGFEYHIPGPLGGELGALMRGKAKGDGRQGGRFADMAYLTSEGNLVIIQTVDVDANGNIAERELRAANSMHRLARNADRDVHIILEKKQWQLQRNKGSR